MGSSSPAFDGRPHWRCTEDELRTWTYGAARAHGLWSTLPATDDQLIASSGWSSPAVSSWLTSAEALNLVRVAEDGTVQPTLPPEDLPSRPGTGGATDGLGSTLTRDTPPHESTWPWPTSGDPRLHEAFHTTLRQMDDAVDQRMEEAPRVLEVGAGDGAWVRHFVRELPTARITAHEHQEHARVRLLKQLRGGDAGPTVSVRSTRAESMRYAGAFDLVHLGQVLPQVPSIVTVLGRANHALERNGILVVDGFLLDDASDPLRGGNRWVRARSFLRYTQGEATVSKQDLWRLLVEAGFQRIRFHPAGPPGAWFGTARA